MKTRRIPKGTRPGSVGAAEFKARCLELIDHVSESHADYTVTRHGRPVAKLVPVKASASGGFLGSMRGSVLSYDRPFDPVPGTWSILADPADEV